MPFAEIILPQQAKGIVPAAVVDKYVVDPDREFFLYLVGLSGELFEEIGQGQGFVINGGNDAKYLLRHDNFFEKVTVEEMTKFMSDASPIARKSAIARASPAYRNAFRSTARSMKTSKVTARKRRNR